MEPPFFSIYFVHVPAEIIFFDDLCDKGKLDWVRNNSCSQYYFPEDLIENQREEEWVESSDCD